MASSQTRPDKGRKRKVIDSDDDTSEHGVVESLKSSKSRLGAPSPTPVPCKSTSSRQSVKRERSSSVGVPPPAGRARVTQSLHSSSSSSASPYPHSAVSQSKSKAEQMAAAARQKKLAAAKELQRKLQQAPTSPSAKAGPSRPPKPSSSVKRSAPTNAAPSSSRLPSEARKSNSSAVVGSQSAPSLGGVFQGRGDLVLVTDGRCVKVEGSNVARFDIDQTWQAFSQFGTISTLMQFVTSKADTTKVLFVTYVDISSANRAIQAMSLDAFPIGQPSLHLWINLSNGKPRLSAKRVKTQILDANTEKWLKGGVVTHRMNPSIAVLPAQRQDGMSSEDDSSDYDSEPTPPLKQLKKSRASIMSSSDSSDSDSPAPPSTARSVSARPSVKVKKEEVFEIASSSEDNEMAMVDGMGMDEDASSSSDDGNDDNAPSPPPPPSFRNLPTFASLRQPSAPPVVAQTADDSSDSDTSSEEEDEEARPSLVELFPEAGSSRLPRAAPRLSAPRSLPILETQAAEPFRFELTASAIAWQRSSAEKYAKWANFINASKSQVLEERARGVAVTHALAWITVQQDYLLSVLEIINTSLTDRRHSRAIKSLKSSARDDAPIPVVCTQCTRLFKNNWNLARHLIVHDNPQRYRPCVECPFVYARLSEKLAHQEAVHGIPPPPVRYP